VSEALIFYTLVSKKKASANIIDLKFLFDQNRHLFYSLKRAAILTNCILRKFHAQSLAMFTK
jgi:hypothetical protein